MNVVQYLNGCQSGDYSRGAESVSDQGKVSQMSLNGWIQNLLRSCVA